MRPVYYSVLVLSLIFFSCRKYPATIEKVLAYSGANRPELEKVIRHYSQQPGDSLKLQAALFLIENMPGHYSLDSKRLQQYHAKLDSFRAISYHVRKMMQTIPYHYPELRREMTVQEDVKCIRAEYLISRIDKAFSQWKENPWLRDTDYETFRDYLLPYRIENEPLDYWRDSISTFRKHIDECMEWYDNSHRSLYEFASLFFSFNNNLPRNAVDPLYRDFEYDCVATSMIELFAMYTIGIPTAIDFTPGFANRNSRHYWMTPIDRRINNHDCFQLKLNTAGKIYRRTYAHHPTPEYTTREYIPPFFLDPFNKDVTGLYLQTGDVRIKIQKRTSNRYAYLAVFNDLQWKPIAWSKISRGEVCFNNLGKHVVYLPVCYDENKEMYPIAPPFILCKDGSVQSLDIQPDSLQTLTLQRKYSFQSLSDAWTTDLLTARFESSDNPLFTPADTVAIIEQQPEISYTSIKISPPTPRRYWRFVPKERGSDLAEVQFLDPEGRIKEGNRIGPDATYANVLFDEDPLSYAYIRNWTGIDFGKPETITEIRYLPRNDANGIYPGNEYELLYYHFPEGWESSGIQIATGNSLTFDKVPAGTLYWLRNHTTGKEERIFTWENNKVRFW